jgi:hypothetical protein
VVRNSFKRLPNEDYRQAIDFIEQALSGHLSEAELVESLKPLLLAFNNGQGANISTETYSVHRAFRSDGND